MPSEVRFAVVRKFLEQHGYTFDRISGSHHVFVKAGEHPIVVPVHGGKVKPFYWQHIRKQLGEP